MTTPNPTHPLGRQERIYRSLLVAYPRDFRDEYGEDLVQGFRDLMVYASDGRGGHWWRITRDLFSSAAKERGSTFSGDRKPSTGLLFVLLAGLVALFIVGFGPALVLVPVLLLVMIGLPTYGVTRFHKAWLVRRSTGGPIARLILVGVASFVPTAATLVWLQEDAGYWIFVTISLTLIIGCSMGLIWATTTLIRAGRDRLAGRQWVRPALVLVPCLAILGFIIGASYNSYRQSLGPAGDHSVENASAETRALWEAANGANLTEVIRLTTETCADPWVKFPYGNGRHNAKGQAETRGMNSGGPAYGEIADILGDYMDVWSDRCGPSD